MNVLMSNVPDIYRLDPGLRTATTCLSSGLLFCLFLSPFCLCRSLSFSLNEALALSMRDEKKTKCLLIHQPCVTALSKRITLITQPKNQPRGIKAKYSDL